MKQFLGVVLLGAVCAFAQQPAIGTGGVVNVASYAPAALPSSAIAQGSMFAVFGSNLGPASLANANNFPLPANVGGTSIKITSGGLSYDAIMLYTSASQVAAILPSTITTGTASMTLTYNGQTSASAPFQITTSNFGAFTTNSAGSGPAAVLNASNQQNTLTNSFNPGETAVLYGTGLGPVSGNEAAGPLPGNMTSVPVEVYVGTTKATVVYSGRSGCCAALDQINFIVPSVLGCRVPLAVKINGNVSNFASISVAASGNRICSDPNGPSPGDITTYLKNGVSVGAINLNRTTSSVTVPTIGTIGTNLDSGTAVFYKYSPTSLNSALNPFQTSTAGACTVTTFKGSLSGLDPVAPQTLDAGGALTVTGASTSKNMVRNPFSSPNVYVGAFGSASSNVGGTFDKGFLDPGAFTVTGAGGTDVGAFTSTITIPQPLVWTNQASVSTVVRAQGQLVTWTGGDPLGTVVITGSSPSSTDSSSYGTSFTCTAKASDGQFTIPPVVLLNLPASPTLNGTPLGTLFVGSNTAVKNFTATGLDTGVFVSTVDSIKNLIYQ